MLQSPERRDRFRKRTTQTLATDQLGFESGKTTKRHAALAATAAILGLLIPTGSANAAGVVNNPAAPNNTIIVNSLLDTNVCDTTTCTLRGAIDQANNAPGDDIIQINAAGTIRIAAPINIVGGASNGLTIKAATVNTVTLVAASNNVILDIPNGANLTLTNLNITGPTATGGNGGNGYSYSYSYGYGYGSNGSNGGSATATLINNTGTLTLNTPTITGPTATGGNGGNSGNASYGSNGSNGANGGNGGSATATLINNTGTLTLNTPTITGPTANGGNSGTAGTAGNNYSYYPTYTIGGAGGAGGSGGVATALNFNNAENGAVFLAGADGVRSIPANAAGWNNTDFSLNWSWDGMGIVTVPANSCVASTAVSTETTGTTVEQTCVGTGGTIKSSATVKLDKTAPVVAVTGVTDEAIYEPGAVPAAGCSTTDALSGVAQNASAVKTGTGPFEVTCSGAIDKAGKTSRPVSAVYEVKDEQTITFPEQGSKTFGTTSTLTASTTSNLPVVFSSSTPTVCTITQAGLLTAATVGSCTIHANQAGNTLIVAAAQVSQTFPVNPAVPGAPTNITATAGDKKATITFVAPEYTGGGQITNYRVTATPAGEPTSAATSTSVHGITATGETSPITVTGLTNGTAYTFTVKACTTGGCKESGPSNEITPKAPQTIEFAAPESIDFGTPPTLVATGSTGLIPTFSSGTRSICEVTTAGAITTLTAGDCTITAAQTGNNATLPATPVTRTVKINAIAPTVPTGIVAVAGNAQATVSFTAPTQTGGAPIAGYTVTASPGGAIFQGATSPIVALGLTNDTPYTFTMTATNGTLTSAPSAPSAPVTPTDPNKPIPVAVVAVTPQPAAAQPVAAQPVAAQVVFLPLGATPTATAEQTPPVEPETTPAVSEAETAPAAASTPAPSAAAAASPEAAVLSVDPSGATNVVKFEATGLLYADATVHSTPFNAGRFYPDSDGVIRGQIILPAGFEAGDHRLELVGPMLNGETKTKNTYFTVKGITVQVSDLALTGADSKNLTAMASLILITGVMLLRRSRRKTI